MDKIKKQIGAHVFDERPPNTLFFFSFFVKSTHPVKNLERNESFCLVVTSDKSL